MILKRSWNLWVLLALTFIIGACYWTAKLTGMSPGQPHSFPGAKARAAGLAAPFLAVFGAAYDLYMRLVRNTRLEFSEAGIGDYASSDRLGEIRWEAVDAVAFKRQWLGATFIINFKDGVRINDAVETWDKVIIGALQVTPEDAARINALLEVHKISGGEDLS